MEKENIICNECGKKQSYRDLSIERAGTTPIYFCDCYSMRLTDIDSKEQVNNVEIVKILTEVE